MEYLNVQLISHFSMNVIIFPVYFNTILAQLLLYEYRGNLSQYKGSTKDFSFNEPRCDLGRTKTSGRQMQSEFYTERLHGNKKV